MTRDSRRRSPDYSSSSLSRHRVHHLNRRRRSLSPPREQHQHKRRRTADDDDRRQGRRPYYPSAEAWPRGPSAVVATMVSLRGFDDRLSARDLADHLESVAGTVWCCRVKTSVTPTGSYPDFQLRLPLPVAGAAASPYDDGVLPAHAFVHFADPRAPSRAARSGLQLCSRGSRRTRRPSAENTTHASSSPRRGIARPMLFPDSRVEVGDLVAPDTFLAAWRGGADDPASASAVDFVVDPSGPGSCRLLFASDAAFASPACAAAAVLCCDVKLEFPVGDVGEVLAFQSDDSLLLRLSAAPLLYYRTAGDDDVRGQVPFDLIDDDDDPWVRTTDITPGGAIGRCWVYRISFRTWFWPTMRVALDYMKSQGVLVQVIDSRWPGLTVHDELEFGMPLQDMFFSLHHAQGISLPVLYLVNALMHSGIVNRHQLTPDFFGLLKGESDAVNIAALTKMFGGKFQLFDVCRRLRNAQDWAYRKPKHLRLLSSGNIGPDDYNAEVRRLVITPTRAYCMPPQLERSNRVIRHYHQLADRFLRVTFMDEGMQRLNTSAMNFCAAQIVKDMMPNSFQQKTTIYRRVQAILTKGFHMCGRKYSFLAFSSNQLRNRSAWFFAEDGTTTIASIREWMGQFPSKNVAKHTARMGQCFTSTYPTVTIQPDEMEFLEDVNHNGYNFSDGIGKITPKLALEVAKKLPLMDNYIPSAFQIRFAGFKGVVAVWPGENEDARLLSLRPSMKKFESAHSVFEVVSWTRLQPAFLNRQIITLLSTLGVPDTVFRRMQNTMLHNLDRILTDSEVAYEVVKTCCSPEHGNTAGLMLSAGFAPANEPHLRAMLLAIRSSQMQGLLEKSRICVPKGRWLVGCLDEFGILEQGQCFIRASTSSFNKSFVRRSSVFSSAKKDSEIIVGTVVMAKNPCLHPGDVRILEAVDVPELHHLVDCLVFPKKGERPHANEASGSDLDGDIYFVTWDKKLVPPGKRSRTPMDYTPAEAKQLPREVLTHDIVDFYLENMVTDNLGRISNAHVVHADRSEDGAMDDKCIQLAELAATAVDSLKTGKIVTMPTCLRPTEYPDFMGKEDDISYKSTKILGELYRSIKEAYGTDFVSEGTCTLDDLPYDSDLEVSGASDFLEDAWLCKCSYEEQLNALLDQYGVRTEAELVTGEAWSLTGNNKKQQYVTKETLSYAYFQLHLEFRRIFESIGEISVDKKNLMYETKASAWYQVTYHPNWIQRSREMPLRLSFAWINVDYLAHIKMRRRQEAKVSKGQTNKF